MYSAIKPAPLPVLSSTIAVYWRVYIAQHNVPRCSTISSCCWIVISASALSKSTGTAWIENTASAYAHCTVLFLCAVHVNNKFWHCAILQWLMVNVHKRMPSRCGVWIYACWHLALVCRFYKNTSQKKIGSCTATTLHVLCLVILWSFNVVLFELICDQYACTNNRFFLQIRQDECDGSVDCTGCCDHTDDQHAGRRERYAMMMDFL